MIQLWQSKAPVGTYFQPSEQVGSHWECYNQEVKEPALEGVQMEVVVILDGVLKVVGEAEAESVQVAVDLKAAKEVGAGVTIRMEVEAAVMLRMEAEGAVMLIKKVEVAVMLWMEAVMAVTIGMEVEEGEAEAKAIMVVGAEDKVMMVKGEVQEEVQEALVETPRVIEAQVHPQ